MTRVDSAGDVSAVIHQIDATFHNSDFETASMTESEAVSGLLSTVGDIRGIVRAFRATPVEVPFFDRVASAAEAVAAVRARHSSRSVALYVSTPSNPTSRLIPAEWLEALADFARRENLWLLSDEVYEDYAYDAPHVSLGGFAPERTFSAFSFSKAYAMAGDKPNAKKAYDVFFTEWKNADADLPVIAEAKKEYTQL